MYFVWWYLFYIAGSWNLFKTVSLPWTHVSIFKSPSPVKPSLTLFKHTLYLYCFFVFSAEKKRVTAVKGGLAKLPCLTAPPNNMRDRIKLVLWFKNESAIPIYT